MSLCQVLFVSVYIINQIEHLPDPTANICIFLLVVLRALPRILLLFVLRTGQGVGIAEVDEYGDGGSGGSWLTRVSLLSFYSTACLLLRYSCCLCSLCRLCCLLRPHAHLPWGYFPCSLVHHPLASSVSFSAPSSVHSSALASMCSSTLSFLLDPSKRR